MTLDEFMQGLQNGSIDDGAHVSGDFAEYTPYWQYGPGGANPVPMDVVNQYRAQQAAQVPGFDQAKLYSLQSNLGSDYSNGYKTFDQGLMAINPQTGKPERVYATTQLGENGGLDATQRFYFESDPNRSQQSVPAMAGGYSSGNDKNSMAEPLVQAGLAAITGGALAPALAGATGLSSAASGGAIGGATAGGIRTGGDLGAMAKGAALGGLGGAAINGLMPGDPYANLGGPEGMGGVGSGYQTGVSSAAGGTGGGNLGGMASGGGDLGDLDFGSMDFSGFDPGGNGMYQGQGTVTGGFDGIGPEAMNGLSNLPSAPAPGMTDFSNMTPGMGNVADPNGYINPSTLGAAGLAGAGASGTNGTPNIPGGIDFGGLGQAGLGMLASKDIQSMYQDMFNKSLNADPWNSQMGRYQQPLYDAATQGIGNTAYGQSIANQASRSSAAKGYNMSGNMLHDVAQGLNSGTAQYIGALSPLAMGRAPDQRGTAGIAQGLGNAMGGYYNSLGYGLKALSGGTGGSGGSTNVLGGLGSMVNNIGNGISNLFS
jgi:hypothetical protein